MPRKPKTPWGDLLGKPIEREDLLGLNPGLDPCIEEIARAEQYRKMCRLKEKYNVEDWYDLTVAVVSEFDDGLKIIDPKPRGKNAPCWGANGMILLKLMEDVKKAYGGAVSEEALLAKVQEDDPMFREMKFSTLKTRYYEAKRLNCKKSTKRRAK